MSIHIIIPNLYTELKKKLIINFSEYVLCCKFLRVGEVSIKVFIFGEGIFGRIHLWSQIYSDRAKKVKKESFRVLTSVNNIFSRSMLTQ